MNKSLLIGLVAGAGAMLGVGALANFVVDGRHATNPAIVAAERAVSASADDERPEGATEADGAGEAAVPGPAASVDEVAPVPVVRPPSRSAPRSLKPARSESEYARVVDVQPTVRTVSEPREVCRDVEVEQQAPVRDQHQIAGSVLGGVIGGVIGNQIGDGDGRKIARVAGAIGGAYAGNKVQERIQRSRKVTTVEKQCETVYESRELPDGYTVTYEWNGGTRTVKMPSDPGPRLPVRGGEVMLAANVG